MGNDLRTALEGAIASGKVEAPAAPAAAPTPAPAPAEAAPATPSPASTVARDEAGRFAGKAPEAPKEGATETPPAAEPKTSQATPPKFKPPQSWKPAVREKWSTLPEDVQEEVDRVERAAADRIRRAAEAEKGYGALRQALTPFEAQLRASGKAIPEALGDALRLVAAVRSGSPQERAAALANLVTEAEQAGVGLDSINAILSQQGQPQAQPKPQEFRDSRFDQFLQAIQVRERQRAQQTVETFATSHEFFGDPKIQAHIAALMEGGVETDLERAYDMAVNASPEHRSVIEQRKAAEAARTGNAATERAVNAASSVRASPVAAAGSAPTDLRSQIVANMRR